MRCVKVECYLNQQTGEEGNLVTFSEKQGYTHVVFDEKQVASQFVVGRNYIISILEEGSTNGN
jgi:hypothetical protein